MKKVRTLRGAKKRLKEAERTHDYYALLDVVEFLFWRLERQDKRERLDDKIAEEAYGSAVGT